MQPAMVSSPLRAGVATATRRLLFFDNLRVVLMIMVIMHHVGQAYGPTGGEWLIQEPNRAAILGPFFTVNRSFGMSLFFMIAGYFTVIACDRKGPLPFLKDRLVRLGIPLLVWVAMMELIQGLIERRLIWPVEIGHLWFVQHLLIYSVAYAGWRMIRPGRAAPDTPPGHAPAWWRIVAFALGLAFVSAVVRIWYPIDRWVYLLGFVRVAFADVPRDLSLFVIGAVAYRRGWVLGFPTRAGRAWLILGLLLAALWYVYALTLPEGLPMSDVAGGLSYAVWESLLCISMCIGLTVLFRDHFAGQSGLGKKLAQAQYTAYVFHIPVVLLFQWLALGLAAAPFVKFVLVSLVTVPVTFFVSYWIRKPLRM